MIRDNLLRLRALLVSVGPAPVWLNSFTLEDHDVPDCGTMHCSMGWAATDPHFQALGLSLDEDGHITVESGDCPTFYQIAAWAEKHFGEKAFGRLFEVRGGSGWDNELILTLSNSESHLELALARIDRQLTHYPE